MPTLDWIGKKAVTDYHRKVPFHLLKCDRDLSVGDPGSGNLLVQGDNLVALKALLPYYAGMVKCIYIDPPYNTGNESWVFNDNVNSPIIKDWLGKAVGKEAEDLSRHDKWLSMMYPRLWLLRQFLRDDGLIFVSVDENEHRNLELVMDEIFGSKNRLETIIWKKSYGGGSKSKHIVNLHEYIICFAKNIENVNQLELPPDKSALKYYKYKDDKYHERGPYRLQPLATTSMDERPNLRYAIPYLDEEIWPEKQWQWSNERVMESLKNDELVISKKKGRYTVSYKQYLRDHFGKERTRKPYSIIEGIYTQQGTNEIKAMFGDGKAFSFPKPKELIIHLLNMATSQDDLILDSFAGSGTTGHAVLNLNHMDGGRRPFILVEMESDICSGVTQKRLSMGINGYKYNAGDRKIEVAGLGGGFRYCNLGPALFDEQGDIGIEVSFDALAAHVYFTETGEPQPSLSTGETPLLGMHNGTAIYLLYNGILGDKRPQGGNALTRMVLANLPPHDGPKVIYGTSCRLGEERLKRENVIFRQIPYAVRVD
jgi:adenine-specific DNA-methyltransferase